MIDEDKPKFRTVKYRQHGLLTRNFHSKTGKEYWTFETFGLSCTHEDMDLINVLDALSEDGYELVTGHDGEYILRTKEEIEEVQEYYETDKGTISTRG